MYVESAILGGRSMVGHTALDRGIGVRIPAPQSGLIYIHVGHRTKESKMLDNAVCICSNLK